MATQTTMAGPSLRQTTHSHVNGTARPLPASFLTSRVPSRTIATPRRGKRETIAMAGQPLGDMALLLPTFVPLLARLVTGGVLIYTALNWVHYRRLRKESEIYMESQDAYDKERQKKLDRLNGKTDGDNESNE